MLPPGCYDIFVEPLKQDGALSDVCTSVSLEKVVIVEGFTTEAVVVFDCGNSPPHITDIVFTPDKFVSFCEAQEVCVTAFDSDADAIEFEWSQISGVPLLAGSTVTKPATTDSATGQTMECVTIMHSGSGTVAMSVRSFDRLQLSNDTTIRREDFYSSLGLNQASRDEVLFPSHGVTTVNCPCIPNAEICDIVDNDCDGQNNEDVACVCMPFEIASCYGGPPGTAGIGECRNGGKVCKLDGSAFETECFAEVLPRAEVCDGLDNDCNGIIDDNLSCSP